MAWIKISDDFDENPKFDHVGALGIAMWLAGMGYCNRNLTDGLIHKSRIGRLVSFDNIGITGEHEGQNPSAVTLGLMLESGLWHADGHDCERCVQPGPHHVIVHDYLDYQPSREEVLAKRAEGAARKAKSRKGKVAKEDALDDVTEPPRSESQRDSSSDSNESQGDASPGASPPPVSRTRTSSNEEVASPISPSRDTAGDREDVDRVCEHLASSVASRGVKRPTITKEWRKHARLLIDSDGYTVEQIIWLIDQSAADDFWMKNILSMPTLRKKADRLKLEFRGRGGAPAGAPGMPSADDNSWMMRRPKKP